MLKERLNLLGKIGCAVCLLGSTVIVIHSPKEEEVATMVDLASKMKDAGLLPSVYFLKKLSSIHSLCNYGNCRYTVYCYVRCTSLWAIKHSCLYKCLFFNWIAFSSFS